MDDLTYVIRTQYSVFLASVKLNERDCFTSFAMTPLLCSPLFHGHKVSNDDGLSMVSAVRTVTLIRKVPYPILLALDVLPRGSRGNKEMLISVLCIALSSLAARSAFLRKTEFSATEDIQFTPHNYYIPQKLNGGREKTKKFQLS